LFIILSQFLLQWLNFSNYYWGLTDIFFIVAWLVAIFRWEFSRCPNCGKLFLSYFS